MGGAETHNGLAGQRPPATVIIVAAGSGERLGADRPKALVPVAGRPMYQWSLLAARRAGRVGAIVLAAPAGFEGEFELSGGTETVAEGHPAYVVTGGAVRSQSVLLALEAVGTDFVLIHDAARPLVEATLFDLVLERLEQDSGLSGVIAATPVTDTIKRCSPAASDLPLVSETLDRSLLWAVQTPQAFRSDVLRAALKRPGALAAATDDAMLVEALGHRVAVLAASAGNFKVTTPEDLARAEVELASRPEAQA